jgi:uncharacterized membrane protein YqjE
MSESRAPASALREAIAAIGSNLRDTARVRLALLAVELKIEASRRASWLAGAVLAAVLLHTALLLATFLVIAAWWDTHRFGAIAGLAAVYAALGGGVVLWLRADIGAAPPAFAGSRAELARDLSAAAP